jgi:hypothetical protein
MPSIVDQIREQQAWEQPKKSGSTGFIVGTVAAFVAGLLLVMSWGAFPSLTTNGLFAAKQHALVSHNKPASVSIPAGGRLGTAAESNLLRTCVPADKLGFELGSKVQNKDLYRLLQASSQMLNAASIMGMQNEMSGMGMKQFAVLWGDVADCVFRQNGWALCEPDNRALAVEAVSAFVRQTAIAAAPEVDSDFNKVMATLQGKRRQSMEMAVSSIRTTRERVLSTLKMRAQEGRFIASDFGFFAPAEVTQAIRDAKPTSDACANKS